MNFQIPKFHFSLFTSHFSFLLFIFIILFPQFSFSQPNIRVGILLNQNSVFISATTNYTIYDEKGKLLYQARSGEKCKILADKSSLKIDGKDLTLNSIIRVVASSGFPLKVNNRYYRGKIKIRVDESNKLDIINELNLEEYLYGVLPYEISPRWPLESQKAQTVVARTFALSRIEQNKDKEFDLTATVSDQVYCGYSCEDAVSNYAVDATYGEVVIYNGELAYTFYHADAGGATENVEEVWGKYLPYLRSVPSDNKSSPYSQWTIEVSRKKIKQLLQKAGIKVGDIYKIKVLSTSSTGRIKLLQIIHSRGVTKISGEKLRTILGYDFLRSAKFKIKEKDEKMKIILITYDLDKELIVLNGWQDTDKRKVENLALLTTPTPSQITFPEKIMVIGAERIPAKYEFRGQGWGHGVGMSQWGAKQLAQSGWNYQQILKYYYKGVKIGKWY